MDLPPGAASSAGRRLTTSSGRSCSCPPMPATSSPARPLTWTAAEPSTSRRLCYELVRVGWFLPRGQAGDDWPRPALIGHAAARLGGVFNVRPHKVASRSHLEHPPGIHERQ